MESYARFTEIIFKSFSGNVAALIAFLLFLLGGWLTFKRRTPRAGGLCVLASVAVAVGYSVFAFFRSLL